MIQYAWESEANGYSLGWMSHIIPSPKYLTYLVLFCDLKKTLNRLASYVYNDSKAKEVTV